MSRIVDEPYFTHSAYSALTTGIQVKCPKCHGAGVVTADEDTDLFVDEISDTAEQAIHSLLMEKLNLALKQLSKVERDFILSYYDMEKPNMTVLASQYGVTRQAADKRLKKIQEKIKKLVAIF